ncbi:hypothetical protein VTJ49DRAFT_5036 [Mycothermus thermophilus]|uniref:Uncharacterized protein n=1 Tax=Humicola insolens TaxID=85995 RepID=A0ABR3V448_HUMIN
MALNWFLDFADRTLLVPGRSAPHLTTAVTASPVLSGAGSCHSCPDITPMALSVTQSVGGTGAESLHLSQRELLRLESELFDTAKYCGISASATPTTQYLTVLTWSDDAKHGTITLFEIHLSSPSRRESISSSSTSNNSRTLAIRRHRRPPLPLSITHRSSRYPHATHIRPVAAMELVPRRILAGLRADAEMRKLALHRDRTTGRFRWTARHIQSRHRHANPRLARLCGVDEDIDSEVRGLPRTEGEPHGIVATIPHLLALMHTTTSIVERTIANGTPVTTELVKTTDGERVRAVSLGGGVTGPRHRGRDVHVVVLIPDGGDGDERVRWVEEPIFWTDDRGGLPEFRQDQGVDDGTMEEAS